MIVIFMSLVGWATTTANGTTKIAACIANNIVAVVVGAHVGASSFSGHHFGWEWAASAIYEIFLRFKFFLRDCLRNNCCGFLFVMK